MASCAQYKTEKTMVLPVVVFFFGVAFAAVLFRFPAVDAFPPLFLRGGILDD